jgi:hypothetical protein
VIEVGLRARSSIIAEAGMFKAELRVGLYKCVYEQLSIVCKQEGRGTRSFKQHSCSAF